MDFDIRGAVINNIHNMNEQELQELVVDSIQRGEEKLLPGLGVLFEVIWQNSSPSDREEMIGTLRQSLARK
ncbi:small acid-soluble spore protein SspI [Thermoactinomyces mirandus]|uniref:Small, acid-soluble spore protein I n=1 Tax=Thermoactinomyces mirandus TaxID=2756294 RepID=A0A7W1XR54_9BACL|nr:small acid-soluble spore protein SspI [Thermoactinomyces mirandus]MBA4601667.1 small acid-soluble spore protein SspI [Thermoactinomyces mirandus]